MTTRTPFVRRAACIGLATGTVFASCASAQTVEFVSVFKIQLYTQTGPGMVQLLSGGEFPYGFDANVEGLDAGLLSAPVVSGPFSNPEPGHNGGVLGFDVDEQRWRYGWPNFNDWGTDTLGELDSLFGNGTYTITVQGVGVALSVTGDVYPSSTPTMTLTGGKWSGGVYVIAADQDLTITTNTYAEYGTHAEDAIFLDIYGPGKVQSVLQFASKNPQNFVTTTVPAGTLTPTMEFAVEAGFVAATTFSTSVPGLPGAIAVSGYDKSTELFVHVIAGGGGGCNPADLAEPYGILDFSDVLAFLQSFGVMGPEADLAPPFGVLDFSDVLLFLTEFGAGCP